MGQEFHVLRCFSCQAFQVQQVKKSKKWSCKMCGEKQSLIKEYGRGTGADCRRHVQKLNLLRGELLEVENERAWTHWETEKDCEAEGGFGDEAQSCEKQVVSRWSKYVDEMDRGPSVEEDDEEDENVYTDRERFRCRGNTRKRKKSFTASGAGGHYKVCEGDSTSAQVGQKSKVKLCEPQQDGYGLGGHGSAANGQPSAELNTKHPSASASRPFAATSSFMSLSATNVPAGGSRWTRFLPAVSVEEDEREAEEDYGEMSDEAADADTAHLSAESPVKPEPHVTDGNAGHLDIEDGGRASLDEPGLCNRTVCALETLRHCVSGTSSDGPVSPTVNGAASEPLGSEQPVCLQPPPFKRPCPALSLRTFFCTDEDFDDAF
ncbi:MRN complex-interacting protein isoform X2 [Brachyhypopomus gauderio]|uniref:MRN complex-interacting protein isoform X2 n=1 Tax=Brachyhypopomus gauderio TaxID=698409 RepID=UPI004041C0B6